MIQHDEPQPPAEAVALQPAVRHAPASIINALTATMTAGSRCPSTSRGTIAALADRDHHRTAPLNRVAQSPRRLNRSTRILKSPFRTPAPIPHARPVQAGVRKPSPLAVISTSKSSFQNRKLSDRGLSGAYCGRSVQKVGLRASKAVAGFADKPTFTGLKLVIVSLADPSQFNSAELASAVATGSRPPARVS